MSSLMNDNDEGETRTNNNVRLALLQERLTVLMRESHDWELESKRWRLDTTLALEKLSREVADVRADSKNLSSDVVELSKRVDELGKQVDGKMGLEWPKGVWRITLSVSGITLVILSIINLLRTIHFP